MRLVGDDVSLCSYKKGSEILGDGASTLLELSGVEHPAYYLINNFSKDEIFLNNHKAGDIYYSINGNEILSEGTSFIPLLETDLYADVKNLIINLSYNEIELTTIDDEIPKYVKTLGDAKGSMSIQVSSEQLKKENSLFNRFIKMATVNNETGHNQIIDTTNEHLFIKGSLYSSNEEQIGIFAQIELYNITLGANMGSAQEFNSSLRFCGANPILMVIV